MNEARSPEAQLHDLLHDRDGVTLACAESCTGGNVAARITSVAGSSAYFLGGIVSYANSAKAHLLGVPEEVLQSPGSVSEPCARAMAEGARRAFGSTIAVATTGIAGPTGGTARKPIGTVFIALATPAGTECQRLQFDGDRPTIIHQATGFALDWLVRAVGHMTES